MSCSPDEIIRYSTGEQILVGDRIRYPGFDSLGKLVFVSRAGLPVLQSEMADA